MSEINYIVTDNDVKPYTVTNRDTTCIPPERKTVQPLRRFSEIFDILADSSAGEVKVSRMSWLRSMYIEVVVPSQTSSFSSERMFCITNEFGSRVPWFPTYEDLFAWDWIVVS